MLILGIETSCDDTSVALIEGEPGTQTTEAPKVLAHQSFSQEVLLRRWGGVVPEIAARNHLVKLVPLLQEVFDQARLNPAQVDLIGVTTLPGLLGPLLTGLNIGKSLALLYERPLLSVNHLFAHLEAIFLTEQVSYPYLGLLVSGGHSLFSLVSAPGDHKILGSTIDDAAGEAFDKGGKLMGLGYPAGAIIDRLAQRVERADPSMFPIGLRGSKDARLSFSGLKTSLRTHLEQNPGLIYTADPTEIEANASEELAQLCANYQAAIIEALYLKYTFARTEARELTGLKHLPLVVGGGVACNKGLRQKFLEKESEVYFVAPEFCTDNGAMIANFALRTAQNQIPFPECLKLDARGRFLSKTQGTV